MNIKEFMSYCIDNAANIYIVERFGQVVSLAEARDKTYQAWKLWSHRASEVEDEEPNHPKWSYYDGDNKP